MRLKVVGPTPHTPPHPIPPSQTTKDAFRIAVFYQPDTFYQGHPWACLLVLNNPHTAHNYRIYSHRRKFRGQTSDNMDRWKAEMGRVREEKRREEERRSKKRKSQKKEDPGAQEKSLNTAFFPMICGSGWSKSRLAKAAGAEPAGQMRDEKLHAVVARNTFASEKAKNTSPSEHFWKLRCRKSARRCGAKHISKSKCTKHLSVRAQRVHAVVARSTFRSQNAQNTSASEHF